MRDYDPTTGRYIQADPLGLVDGASVYGYALQSPLRYADPRGENAASILFGVLKASLKKTLQPLVKKGMTKQLKKNGWVCTGTRRDHHEGKNCPDGCPERVWGVNLDKGKAQAIAKKAAPRQCRAFYGHFRCHKISTVLKN